MGSELQEKLEGLGIPPVVAATRQLARRAASAADWSSTLAGQFAPPHAAAFGTQLIDRYELPSAPGRWADNLAQRMTVDQHDAPALDLTLTPHGPAQPVARQGGAMTQPAARFVARLSSGAPGHPPLAFPEATPAASLLGDLAAMGWGQNRLPAPSFREATPGVARALAWPAPTNPSRPPLPGVPPAPPDAAGPTRNAAHNRPPTVPGTDPRVARASSPAPTLPSVEAPMPQPRQVSTLLSVEAPVPQPPALAEDLFGIVSTADRLSLPDEQRPQAQATSDTLATDVDEPLINDVALLATSDAATPEVGAAALGGGPALVLRSHAPINLLDLATINPLVRMGLPASAQLGGQREAVSPPARQGERAALPGGSATPLQRKEGTHVASEFVPPTPAPLQQVGPLPHQAPKAGAVAAADLSGSAQTGTPAAGTRSSSRPMPLAVLLLQRAAAFTPAQPIPLTVRRWPLEQALAASSDEERSGPASGSPQAASGGQLFERYPVASDTSQALSPVAPVARAAEALVVPGAELQPTPEAALSTPNPWPSASGASQAYGSTMLNRSAVFVPWASLNDTAPGPSTTPMTTPDGVRRVADDSDWGHLPLAGRVLSRQSAFPNSQPLTQPMSASESPFGASLIQAAGDLGAGSPGHSAAAWLDDETAPVDLWPVALGKPSPQQPLAAPGSDHPLRRSPVSLSGVGGAMTPPTLELALPPQRPTGEPDGLVQRAPAAVEPTVSGGGQAAAPSLDDMTQTVFQRVYEQLRQRLLIERERSGRPI